MSKMSALEAYKIKIVLDDMVEKLEFIHDLKHNMGEEMAEMMSEEITKVMEQQRNIEGEYARLVQQRDELKGITNKKRLEETKEEIQNIAKDLKDSTKKLCRQLQKKPAVEGNQKQVLSHKKKLIELTQGAVKEMMEDLYFTSFQKTIEDTYEESIRYKKLKEEERHYTNVIQETTAKYKKLQNEFTREQEESTKEMQDLKKQKNEAQVEKDLHIQYMERSIDGKQSCENRLHQKKETELRKKIEDLEAIIKREQEVNDSVKAHLQERIAMLKKKYDERDQKREEELLRIENERQEIRERKTKAENEERLLIEKINQDNEERNKREEEDMARLESDEQKVKDRMNMDDAARYIQRRWNWFQTEGKFLAKKGKKGRKGKKKKKK